MKSGNRFYKSYKSKMFRSLFSYRLSPWMRTRHEYGDVCLEHVFLQTPKFLERSFPNFPFSSPAREGINKWRARFIATVVCLRRNDLRLYCTT